MTAKLEDPKLKYDRFMHEHVRSPVCFENQISKSRCLNDAIKPLNEKRFDFTQEISDWNGKFGSRISQPFGRDKRITDIPGTVLPTNF